jgi:glycogen operon protein
LCFNAHDHDVEFVMPPNDYAEQWTMELDTNHPAGNADQVVNADEKVLLPSRSLLVLRKTL